MGAMVERYSGLSRALAPGDTLLKLAEHHDNILALLTPLALAREQVRAPPQHGL